MPSPVESRSSKTETPAYVRVFRAYLRNASSPSVWAPLAVIALLLALSADYWQSLTVLNEDTESLISENVSELADSVSEASSIAASEIDSSDVLSDLLSQARLPVMADDDSTEDAQATSGRVNLEEIDLLELPDLAGAASTSGSAGGEGGDTERPTRRFGLLDLISGNANSTSGGNSPNSTNTAQTAASPALADSESRFNFGRASQTGTDATGDPTFGRAAGSGFSSGLGAAPAIGLTNATTAPAASSQFGASPSTFTGYPYSGNVAVPNVSNVAPSFTGYPPASGSAATPNVPSYTGGGFTGYPAPSATQYGTGAQYGQPQFGQPQQYSAPSFNNPTGGVPTPDSSPTEAQGVQPEGATVNSPTTPYSVPRSAPGRYIGNGEINTFGNP